jgi:hypothetical protein
MKALVLLLSLSSGAGAWPWDKGSSAELVYEIEESGKPSIDEAVAARAAETLRKRFSSFGLSGKVERRGVNRIALLVTAEGDAEQALKPLLKPSLLEFRFAFPDKTKPGRGEAVFPEAELDAATGKVRQVPRVVGPAILTGSSVASARAGQELDRPVVHLELTPEAAVVLGRVTAANLGRSLAVVIDGRVLSIAVIQTPISGGRVSLSGRMDAAEAADTARRLAGGPLPDKLTLVKKTVDGKSLPLEAPPVAVAARKSAPAAPPPPAAPPEPVSDVDAAPPAVPGGENGVAVVIGVERSRQGLPRADFAARDARVFADYLTKTLGYPEKNVVLLLDERAAKSDLEKYLEDWLPGRARPGSTVVVYFSGHGAPSAVGGAPYLVPYDGDPSFLAKTAYPVKRLYETLGKLEGRRVVVLLDACFSGAGSRSALAKGARPLVGKPAEPVVPPTEVAVLSAAASDQIGGSFDEQGHGLFTYHLLSAIKDAAAAGRRPTLGGLYDSLSGKVEAQSRRRTGNEQTPQLQASEAARRGAL